MNNHSNWKIKQGAINDHHIWMINDNGVEALFKQPRDAGAYKLVEITNELVFYELALRGNIPMAETFMHYLDGKIGVMSIIHSRKDWGYVVSNNLKNNISNMDMFRQLFAFDVWTVNTNRDALPHVIVIPDGTNYRFYAIDHGHTLNGCTQGEQKWQLENITDVSKFQIENLNHISVPEIRSFSDLEPMVKRIEEIQDSTIDGIVDSACMLVSKNRPVEEQEALSKTCEVIKALLKFRRDNLRAWLMQWCVAKGKIEMNN